MLSGQLTKPVTVRPLRRPLLGYIAFGTKLTNNVCPIHPRLPHYATFIMLPIGSVAAMPSTRPGG